MDDYNGNFGQRENGGREQHTGWQGAEPQASGPEGWNRPPEEPYRWNYDDYGPEDRDGKNKGRSKGVMVFASILCGVFVVGLLTLSGLGLYAAVSGKLTAGENTQGQRPAAEESAAAADAPSLQLNSKPGGGVSSNIYSEDGVLTTQQIAAKLQPSVVGIVNYTATGSLMTSGTSEGSGIILTEDGYILTNAHVVSGASGLKVVMNDGSEYSGQIKGIDERTDLAVIKVDAAGLQPAEFGNSDELEIGEKVVAIGNPGGLELASSVTQGIVSGLNRPVSTSSSDIVNCIQTDAAINPGNSGGPLVNEYGQVVGINSSKIANVDYEGIGFAISINDAQPIIDDLMAYGAVRGRVKIGVTIVEVDEYLARLNNVPTGIFVQSVEADSSAAAQGVVPGDVITHINGTRVQSLMEVRAIIDDYEPGDEVTLTIYRRTTSQNARELEITIQLMEDISTSVSQEATLIQ